MFLLFDFNLKMLPVRLRKQLLIFKTVIVCLLVFLGGILSTSAIAATATTTTISSGTNPSTYGSSVTFTASVTGAGGTPTGTVTFKDGASTLGTVTLSGGSATFSTSGLTGGTHSMTAEYGGDASFDPSTSSALSQTVNKATQATLTLTAGSQLTFNTTEALSTTGGSGTGAVTYQVTSGGCAVESGNQLKATSGTGSCSVTATKAADTNYNSITSASVTVTLQKANQSALNFTPTSPMTYNTSQLLSTTGGSGGGGVTYAVTVGSCTVFNIPLFPGDYLRADSGTGTCTVEATKAGDANYNPITTSAPVTLQKVNVTVTLSNLNHDYDGSQKKVTVTTNPGSVAVNVTYNGLTNIPVSAGSYTVVGTLAEPDNYQIASGNPQGDPPTATLVISKINQAIVTLTAGSPLTYDSSEQLSASGGSGTGGIFYQVTAGGCKITGGSSDQLTATSGTGTCSVVAVKYGDLNYHQATSSPVTVTLQKQAVTLVLNAGSPLSFNSTEPLSVSGGGAGAVTYQVTSGNCTVSGNQLTATSGTGSCNISATQVTDGNYEGGTASGTVTLQKAIQPTLVLTAGSPLTYNTSETLSLSGGGGSGAVSLAVTAGNCTLAGYELTANTGIQSCSIVATKAADSSYLEATASATVFLQKASQSPLTFNPSSPLTYGSSQTLSATGGSGTGAVIYDVASGGCTVAGNQLTATSGTGACTVKATNIGDDNYSAIFVSRQVTLQKANQSALTFNPGSPLTYNNSQTLSATGGSGSGAVIYQVTAGGCAVAGNQLTATSGTGTCSITATKAADNDFNAASASGQVTLQKANQPTLLLIAGSPLTFNTTETLNTSGGGGIGAVTYTVTAGSCTVVNDQLTANNGTGTCTVTATKVADDNFNAASASGQVTLQKANQSPLTLFAGSPLTVNTTETLSTTGGSGTGALTYQVTGGCTVSFDQLTATSGVGSCYITATKAADSDYFKATVSGIVTLQKANLSTLILTAGSPLTYNTTETLSTSGGGTGAVTYQVTSGDCTVVGDQLTADSGNGTCTVTATKAADANNSESTASVQVTLQKANQAALTFIPGSPLTYNTTETLSTSGGSGTGAVTYQVTSGNCTVVRDELTANSGSGFCTVTATKAADINFSESSVSVPVILQKANQSPLLLNAGSPLTYNTTKTLSTSGGSGAGAVTYMVTSGSCTVVGDQITPTSGTGSCSISATKAADDNYLESTVSGIATLQQADQSPLVLNAGTPLTYNTTETLSTSGGSGIGAVTYQVTSGSCTVVGNQLTATSGMGSCSVIATKAADSNFSESSVSVQVTLQKAVQSPLALIVGSPLLYNTTETLSTSGGSGTGAVTYQVTSGSCTVVDDQLTVHGNNGTCSITATKAADDNFSESSVSRQLTVQEANQSTLVLIAGSPLVYDTSETLSTSGGNGIGAVTYQVTSGSCTVVGNQLTANSGTGTCTITATKAADSNFSESSASAQVTLQKANQSLLVLNAGSPLTYNTTETLSTNGGSGTGAVSYQVTSGGCTVAGDQLTATSGTGSCLIVATKDSDDNYKNGSASGFVVLNKAEATISLDNLVQTYNGNQKTAIVSTEPQGLTVDISYGGSVTPPTDTGKYDVLAIINDPNYSGMAFGLLTIAQTPPVTVQALPAVVTSPVKGVTKNGALSGGNVIFDGGAAISEHGVCWNVSGLPTLADSCINGGSGTGSFVTIISGLTPGATYYVRAFVTNSVGTTYGEVISFITTIPTWVLNINKTGNGKGKVTSLPEGIDCDYDCEEIYEDAAVVQLTATPEPGSKFTGWSGDEDCDDGIITMNSDVTCMANFYRFPWEMYLPAIIGNAN